MDVTAASNLAGTSVGAQKALKDAVDGFHSILTDDQRDKLARIGTIRDAETVMIFTAQLDRENQLRKGRGVASRLISVLQSVQAFSTVVDTFVSANPNLAALVWGSIKFAMLIAVNYTSYFEALSSLFMSFSNHCPRFAEYQALYPASTRLQKALCDFHASIVRCCKHVVEATQRPWQKQLTNAFWQSFHQEFKPYTNDIQNLAKEVAYEIELAKVNADRQEQNLQEMERAAASKQRSRFQRFIPAVEKELDTIKKLQLQQSTRRSREERQRLLESLSSHDHVTPFREACKKRQCNTAEWILTTPEFTRWYNGAGSSLLWCSGKIGSGKTILCANTINHIFANKGHDTRIAFFFLQYNNSESLKAETTIRSIIRQSIDATILSGDIELQLRELLQKPFVDFQAWVDLARQAIKCSSVFYIFVDGLDESDATERRALLDALSSLVSNVPGLRMFIASRYSVHLDLRHRFSRMEHVSIAPETLASDIGLYIEATLQERIENEDLITDDLGLLDEIKQRLTQHADGMFLWVAFLISEICTASCDDEIRHFLRTLPRDLEETFSRALSRIVSRQKMADLAQKVFRCVVAAKRPLTLDELREAISIEIGQEYSRPERLVRGISRIVLWCENLVQVTEGETRLVQFAHSTVRDFMVGGSLPLQLTAFHVDLEEADHFIGEICVTYLHFNDFKTTIARRPQPLRINPTAIPGTVLKQKSTRAGLATGLSNLTFRHSKARESPDLTRALASYGRADDNILDSLQQSHPFLKYAMVHWISHTGKFQERKSATWSLWYGIVTEGHSLARIPWQNSTSLTNDAILNWSHQAHHYALLRYSCGISTLQESKKDRLMVQSASRGDIQAIIIFLEAGKFSMDGINRALQAASGNGHLQVVDRLLAAGADVYAAAGVGYNGQTALQAASESGHLQIVDRLVAAKADVNVAAGYNRRTTLQAASGNGHLQVVDRLLAAGADVNAAGGGGNNGRTALQAASESGHLQIVNRLLAAKADVNAAAAADYNRRTALQAASGNGHLQVVDRLLAAGADVNAAAGGGYNGRTALQAASESGHLQVVDRLLAAGADVNAAAGGSHNGRTALQAASESGHLQVVDRLLAAGADVQADAAGGHNGRTALQAASESGHLQVVDRLLAAGSKRPFNDLS